MTHPGTPRDVDLSAWRDKFAFHPADTKAKQLGHQLARKSVMALAELLHWLVPPSDDKSVMFRLLGDVLMLANRSLAVNGGPSLPGDGGEEYLEAALMAALRDYERTSLPEDPRIREYEAQQRGEAPKAPADTSWVTTSDTLVREPEGSRTGLLGAAVTRAAEPGIAGEKPSEDDGTFAWAHEDGGLTLRVEGGRAGVGLTIIGPVPPEVDEGDRGGWTLFLDTPQATNEALSAIAAAGERAFGHR